MNKIRSFSVKEGATTKNYEIVSGYPTCEGCDELTAGTPVGWCCMFGGVSGVGCQYPDQMIKEKHAKLVGSSTVIK